MKSIFKSKTAAVAFIVTAAGLVGQFVPQVGEWVASNSALILMGLGVISFGLRLVTKGSVELFPSNDI